MKRTDIPVANANKILLRKELHKHKQIIPLGYNKRINIFLSFPQIAKQMYRGSSETPRRPEKGSSRTAV